MKSVITAILCLFSVFAGAQQIPSISGETGDKKHLTLPGDARGKFTLLCFASSHKAQKDLEGWLDPVYQKFIAKTGIMDDMFDVNVYFIPLLRGANAAMGESLKKKFRENAQDDLKPHVLFCKDVDENALASLNMNKDYVPYFFLLDKEGQVIYRTEGAYTEEKFDAIDERIE
jgi:hypothetical protein